MGRIWSNGTGLALNATNLNGLESDVARGKTIRWTPSTAYNAGDAVINPSGVVATALAAHTSGTSYNSANWALNDRSAVLGPTFFPSRPIVTPITTFQPGYTWTSAAGGGVPFAADTTNHALGTQSIKGSTSGTGGVLEISNTSLAAMNLTGKGVAFQIMVDNPDKLNYATLYWGDTSFTNFYTTATLSTEGTGASDRLLANDWTWVYVPMTDIDTTTGSPNSANVTAMKIRFADNNTGPVTVNVQQIGTYSVSNPYPNGVLTVTCDDSLLSQYTYLPQILGKYNAPATLLMIQDQMPGTQGFSIDQAHWMQDKLGYELGGHAYTKANHDVGFANLSTQALVDELGSLKAWLRREGFNGQDLFAWPVGSNSASSTQILAKYFSWARHTGGKYAHPVTPGQPLRHPAVTMTSDTPVATFKGYIDTAKAHGRHLTFMVHQIVASGASGQTNVNAADLQSVIDYAVSVGMPIRTAGQVLKGQ